MIECYLIRSKDQIYYEECLASFYATTPNDAKITIIDELATREETLNKIFKLNNFRDLICIADDVILTKGWYEIIEKNLTGVRSIGFSMSNPVKAQAGNSGFDLAEEHGKIRTIARSRHIPTFETHTKLEKCTTFTGCFIAISSNCFELVSEVPLDGFNRIGELLYHVLLARQGGEVLVSNHHLFHYSVSTKQQNSIEKIYSESYQDEKKIWDNAITKYCLKDATSIKLYKDFSKLPKDFSMKFVIWGAGSLSEYFIHTFKIKPDYFISGLAIENEYQFYGREVYYFKEITHSKIPTILIAVENMQNEIASQIMTNFQVDNLFYIEVNDISGLRMHNIKRFPK